MPEAHGLYFADLGEGPPLVLLHALGLNSGMWALQVPILTQRYRVIRPDIRGHGRSLYNGESLNIQSLAEDLLSIIDYLELSAVGIVGLSMGGMIAQQFAITHPERVAALALVSTVSRFSDDARRGLLERGEIAREQGMAPLIPAAIERWFSPHFREAAKSNPLTVDPDKPHSAGELHSPSDALEATMVGAISRMLEYTDPKGYAAACDALAQADLTSQLNLIQCPTLVSSGGLDPGISRESQDVLRGRISKSTESVYPEASHLVPVECSSEFSNQLLDFLAWSNFR